MKVKISDIVVNKRLRTIDKDRVSKLAGSIKVVGLLNPITVTPSLQLVAGAHRIAAATLLGMTEIEATILNVPELIQELAEIDENLIRHDLNFLEKGHHLVRRKEIIELLYPETKQGGNKDTADGKFIARTADNATRSFVKTTAEETGISERTIHEDIQIARDLVPEFQEAVKDSDITKTQALQVSRLEPEKQKEILLQIKSMTPPSFGKEDVITLDAQPKDVQKKAVDMVTSGDSSSLKMALKKLNIAPVKTVIPSKQLTCVCGKVIKIDWSKHTVEII